MPYQIRPEGGRNFTIDSSVFGRFRFRLHQNQILCYTRHAEVLKSSIEGIVFLEENP